MNRVQRRALRAVYIGAAAAVSSVSIAHAQTVPADQATVLEEIIVTGFRGSLNSAIQMKRQENGVVDAIKAEDIADFPDLNLAESLQRISGVAITRVQGEGRQISVRGLGSEYTRVRVNGMEAITTSSGTANSGGTNRGRGFDFNIFASDLFNSLAVRKTASADVEEGSLGATVDLQTARPFDYKKPQLVTSIQGSYNDLARDVQPRATMLASSQFADGKFGLLFSGAYEKRHLLEEGANITRWTYGGSNGGFNTASTVPGLTIAQINSGTVNNSDGALYHPRIPAYVRYDIASERLGLTASAQWQPDDDTIVTLDVLYSNLKGTRKEAQLQGIGLSRSGVGKPQTIIRDGVVDENNGLVYARMDNVDLRTQSAYDELNTKFQQYSLLVTHDFSSSLRGGITSGYSDSLFNSPVSTIITFDRANSQNYSYDFRTRLPAINLGFDPTNPANWAHTNGTSEVRLRPQSVENQFTNLKTYGEYDLNDSITLKAGVDWRKFEYESHSKYRTSETVVQTLTAAEVASVSKVFSGFGRNLGMPFGNATSWLVPDLDAYARTYNIYSNSGIYAVSETGNATARGQFGTVTEGDLGFYTQADFHFDAMGIPFRGDVGVRHVKTDQTSSGYAALGGSVDLVTATRSYNMTLPSANITAEVSDDFLVRLAAAKTIARPSIGTLSPGGDVQVQGANRNFTTGNPDLKPTMSKNVDLSFEWYPGPLSQVSVGLFYKKINTFVQTLRYEAIYNTLGLPNSLLAGTSALPTDTFTVTSPVNSNGGDLTGIEVSWQQPLDFLPGWLSNFGYLVNYTYVNSDIEYLTSTTPGARTVKATLVGLSKHASNATLYYETDTFSIRGSVSYRAGYLTQVPGNDGMAYHGTNSTTNFDMSASYNITKDLKFTVEAINLTDEKNDLYVDDTNRLNAYTHSGRQFLVGMRYQF